MSWHVVVHVCLVGFKMYLTCFAAVERTTCFIIVRCVPTEKKHWYVAFYGFVLFCNVKIRETKNLYAKKICRAGGGQSLEEDRVHEQVAWLKKHGMMGDRSNVMTFYQVRCAKWISWLVVLFWLQVRILILNLLPHGHRVVWSKKMFWKHRCYVHASSLCSQSNMICDVYIQIHIYVLFSVMLGTFAIGRSGSAPKQGQHEGVFLFLLMGTMTMMASGDAVNPREKPWGTSQTL